MAFSTVIEKVNTHVNIDLLSAAQTPLFDRCKLHKAVGRISMSVLCVYTQQCSSARMNTVDYSCGLAVSIPLSSLVIS